MSDPLERLKTVIGPRYSIVDRIGIGGNGTVYLARDVRHSRQVAIKVMRDDLAESVSTARFLREIEIAGRLQHPHILPLFDSGESDGILYYIMPFVEGESLRARIDRERQLSFNDVCRITRQIASALTYAHSQGIVHRDVKPHNILLSQGEAVVADFGIARALMANSADSLTFSGTVIGTPLYMSPEQATGGTSIDGRADQYALACVVYEMLAGEPPFRGATPAAIVARHLTELPPPLVTVRPSLPKEAERVIATALSKVPADRFSSATVFANSLEAAIAAPQMIESAPSTAASDRSSKRRPTNAGRLVSKTCNRWMQMNAFDSFLRTSWKNNPGRPQLFVIHGEEGQGHDSLLERLLATSIAGFAEELDGAERGSVVRIRAPWPATDDLDLARRDLAISLFREADPRYMDDDLEFGSLRKIIAKRLGRVVVVHHDVRATSWGRHTANLLDWYANSFYGSLEARRSDPQFLVFVKVMYAPQSPGLLGGLLGADFGRRKRIQQALDQLARNSRRCGVMVFSELQSVTADDVKDWFNSNYIYESELEREAGVKAIFRGAARKRMADVEPALAEIHEFVMGAQQWRGASL